MDANVSQRLDIYRRNQRHAGLRRIQLWVPDTRRVGFAEECARQSQVVRESQGEADMLDFTESETDLDGQNEAR